MRFTLGVLSAAGDVDGLRPFASAQLRPGGRGSQLIRRFETMLREGLRAVPGGGHKARAVLDEPRAIWLDWFQPWSFSALGSVMVAGELAWTLVFLTGYCRELEGPTFQAVEMLQSALTGRQPRPGLRQVEERPLVLCLPWGRSPAGLDLNDLVGWVVCLAAAYFERAAERWAEMPPELRDSEGR